MEEQEEVPDTALREGTPALGTDTTALTGSGTGRERGVLGRGSITGRGAGVGGGMRSTGEQRRGSIMMRGTERETGRGLGSLRGRERGSVKGSREHRKLGSRKNQEKEKEQSQEGREKEEKGRGKEDENSLRIIKYSKIAATRLQKLLKSCHLIFKFGNFNFTLQQRFTALTFIK